MNAGVKALLPACPVGKELHLTSNIPFLDRNTQDVYSTRFQEDFPPFYSKRTEPVQKPAPARVDHKDLRHIKEYLTEAMVSYQHHPLPHVTPNPSRTMYKTNLRMQTDPREIVFLTTHGKDFLPHPFQTHHAPTRPTQTSRMIRTEEKPPESTARATFVTHPCCPLIKAPIKHQEGFPTIKGDGRHHNFVSHYNNAFQGALSQAAQPMEKHSSSVIFGDPVKILETKTTHAASFSRPTICRLSLVKEPFKLNLGKFSKDSWSSTSRDAFCYHKFGDPVVRVKKSLNLSSIPEGDTDVERNRERMSVTTNRVTFSDPNHSQRPSVPASDLVTKSHIQLSLPTLSDHYYTTTVREHFCKKDGGRAAPVIQLSGKILCGPADCATSISTTMADFTPQTVCKTTPPQSQHETNLRFPLGQDDFSTTHSEAYTAKPLSLQQPHCNQFLSHLVLK